MSKGAAAMFQNSLTGQILFLLVAGFSLLIVVFSHCFDYRNDPPLHGAGPLFFSPLLIFVFLDLYQPALTAGTLIIGAETTVGLGLLILLSVSSGVVNRRFIISLYIWPFILIGLSLLPIWDPVLPALNKALVYANVAFFAAALIQCQRRCKKASILTLAILSMTAAQPLALWADSPDSRIAYVFLQGLGLGCFFLYFYNSIRDNLNQRIEKANRLVAEWDRTVKYEVLKRTIDFEYTHRKLLDKNKMDGLAKCYNKIAISQITTELIRKGQNFTILMIDIDNFKDINDSRGHLIGDQILVKVAQTIQASIRKVDSLGRWGGDEFLITLPRTDVLDATYVAKRIQQNTAKVPDCPITLSIGIAAFPQDGNSSKQLIGIADKGLYLSKQRGRNAVSYASEPHMKLPGSG